MEAGKARSLPPVTCLPLRCLTRPRVVQGDKHSSLLSLGLTGEKVLLDWLQVVTDLCMDVSKPPRALAKE